MKTALGTKETDGVGGRFGGITIQRFPTSERGGDPHCIDMGITYLDTATATVPARSASDGHRGPARGPGVGLQGDGALMRPPFASRWN
jgi:hypothetical protein